MTNPEVKTMALTKPVMHYIFRYEVGSEQLFLDALVELVHRKDLPFDWFDAAVLSHQVGQHFVKQLKTYLPKKAS